MADSQILIENLNLGGIADSDYLGGANSVSAAVGLDVHTEPGIIQVNQKLTKESGSTVDVMVHDMVVCSDGNTYAFGNSGKIYKRTAAGSWTLERTASPAAGSANITNAKEYSGYVYYAMQNRLGRWQVGQAWSAADDNWATFANGDADFHPMLVLNLILYIGDKNYVAQVEDETGTHIFVNKALDIRNPLRIKCLGPSGVELLIGTYIADNVAEAEVIRWNTWSPSFSASDPVPEVGINAFLHVDNYVYVQAGKKGNLYLYSSDLLQQVKRIKGSWGLTNRAEVKPNAVASILGLPLFGLSNVNGNPALQGVYSFGVTGANYPRILNLEHVISTGATTGITIGAIAFVGGSSTAADVLLVSWFDGTNYGVDVLDVTAKATSAYFDTRMVTVERDILHRVSRIDAAYRTLPDGTSIEFWVSKNHGAFTQITDVVIDTARKIVSTEVTVEDVVAFKVRVKLVASGNSAPELEKAIITL